MAFLSVFSTPLLSPLLTFVFFTCPQLKSGGKVYFKSLRCLFKTEFKELKWSKKEQRNYISCVVYLEKATSDPYSISVILSRNQNLQKTDIIFWKGKNRYGFVFLSFFLNVSEFNSVFIVPHPINQKSVHVCLQSKDRMQNSPVGRKETWGIPVCRG